MMSRLTQAAGLLVVALVPVDAAAQMATTFACSGNEPFWSLSIDGKQARFTRPTGDGVEETNLAGVLTSVDYLSKPLVVWRGRGEGMEADVVAFIAEKECNDTMSGRQHSHSTQVSLPDGNVVIGCCSIETKHAVRP